MLIVDDIPGLPPHHEHRPSDHLKHFRAKLKAITPANVTMVRTTLPPHESHFHVPLKFLISFSLSNKDGAMNAMAIIVASVASVRNPYTCLGQVLSFYQHRQQMPELVVLKKDSRSLGTDCDVGCFLKDLCQSNGIDEELLG